MEITQQKVGEFLILRLAGRLDANWCGHVEKALSEAIRAGEHRIQVDMSQVGYMSSMGIRVLMAAMKQLSSIKGSFSVVEPSANIRSVLELAGLGMLITQQSAAVSKAAEAAETYATELASYEIFPLRSEANFEVKLTGDRKFLEGTAESSASEKIRFQKDRFAFGVGALGSDYADCAPRLGEFLAISGVGAYQPSDGASRPDYAIQEGELIPEGVLSLGFQGAGQFAYLSRFSPAEGLRTLSLSELAGAALKKTNSKAVVMALVTETCGLVGATLRQSPAAPAGSDRFAFPVIREWLSFTNERAFRDSASFVLGIAAIGDSKLSPLLRPIGGGLMGHFHAASFPYRPLQKGKIDFASTLNSLFEGQNLQAVLHLLSDPREINGAGESEFYRGALWFAPIAAESL